MFNDGDQKHIACPTDILTKIKYFSGQITPQKRNHKSFMEKVENFLKIKYYVPNLQHTKNKVIKTSMSNEIAKGNKQYIAVIARICLKGKCILIFEIYQKPC